MHDFVYFAWLKYDRWLNEYQYGSWAEGYKRNAAEYYT